MSRLGDEDPPSELHEAQDRGWDSRDWLGRIALGSTGKTLPIVFGLGPARIMRSLPTRVGSEMHDKLDQICVLNSQPVVFSIINTGRTKMLEAE